MGAGINRREFMAVAAAAAAGCAISKNGVSAVRKPNIVLILVDDMGYSDLGCYGGEIRTPTIDRLAKRGLRFTQFYNTAKCGPTRATLMTGLYYPEVGEKQLRDCVTLAEAMKQVRISSLGEISPAEDFEDQGPDLDWSSWNRSRDEAAR